jgi:hypothetical protein
MILSDSIFYYQFIDISLLTIFLNLSELNSKYILLKKLFFGENFIFFRGSHFWCVAWIFKKRHTLIFYISSAIQRYYSCHHLPKSITLTAFTIFTVFSPAPTNLTLRILCQTYVISIANFIIFSMVYLFSLSF